MPAILSAHDLSLWYGAHQALHNISIDIPEKSITALIGPSGCGKSTFLKTLNRMNDLVSGVKITGEVTYEGENIYDPSVDVNELRKSIGMVFQKPNPFPMSIYDNIAYGPRTHGIRNKAKLDDIVEKSLRGAAIWDEVKDRLKKNALGLSGGQQQRLCIARALAEGAFDGRADQRTRPHFHLQNRRPCHAAARAVHDRHRDPQHAAGRPHFGHHRVFPARRARGVRPDRANVLPAAGQAHRGLHHGEVWIMRNRFDEQLNVLSSEMIRMGALCEEVIALAAKALDEGDQATIDEVTAKFDPATPQGEEFLREYFAYFGYGYLDAPQDIVPDVPLLFYSFRVMVGAGCFFILLLGVVWWLNRKDRLADKRWLLWIAVWSVPLAYLASQAGWVLAEVGRQPWAIQDLMPVGIAASKIGSTSVTATFFIFLALFTALLIAELSILFRQIKIGPEQEKE